MPPVSTTPRITPPAANLTPSRNRVRAWAHSSYAARLRTPRVCLHSASAHTAGAHLFSGANRLYERSNGKYRKSGSEGKHRSIRKVHAQQHDANDCKHSEDHPQHDSPR